MDEATADYFGINRTDSRCMDILSRQPSMGMGDLAHAMRLSTAATTTVVDRLERAGYVRRVADKQDRRRVLVQLTASAQRRGQQLFAAMIKSGSTLLSSYSEQDLELISDFIQRSRSLVDQQADFIRGQLHRKSRASGA